MMRGKLIITTIIGLLVFLYASRFTLHAIYAAESSPSADIRNKLEELKKGIASKAAKLKNEIRQKLINKAYAGKIENTTETSATLLTKSGAKIITINQDTIFESKIKTKKKFTKLLAGDYIATLGDIDDTGVLTAKKVILLPSPPNKEKIYLWGQVSSHSGSLLTIRDRDLKSITISLSKTEIPPELKLNKSVIVTAYQTQEEIIEANFIFIIP